MSPLHGVLQQLSHSHLPWLVLTMAVYLVTLALYKRSRCHPLLIPVFPSVVIIVGCCWPPTRPTPPTSKACSGSAC